jgi:phage shock protein A
VVSTDENRAALGTSQLEWAQWTVRDELAREINAMIDWLRDKRELAKLRAQYSAAQDDWSETYANLQQHINTAESRVAQMEMRRDPAKMDELALKVAEEIEDIFANGGWGGRLPRLRHVHTLVLGAIQKALKGEQDYDLGWRK